MTSLYDIYAIIDAYAAGRGLPWILPDGVSIRDIRRARARLRAGAAYYRNTCALGARRACQLMARRGTTGHVSVGPVGRFVAIGFDGKYQFIACLA